MNRHAYTITCRRCGRKVNPWPLGRKRCSPPDWVYCIRNDFEADDLEIQEV